MECRQLLPALPCRLTLAAPLFLPSIVVLWMGIAGYSTAVFGQRVQLGLGRPGDARVEDPYGVYLPTDRTLSRGMSRARERLVEGEYHEALEFLQQILDRDEDVLFEDSAEAGGRGLKAMSRELIAGLPREGRQLYELLYATDARRRLEAVLQSGDRHELTQLVRRYLLTPAGYEAVLILAQVEVDRGHPSTAAQLYQALLDDPLAASRFEPQLSLLAASTLDVAGQTDQVLARLRSLIRRQADGSVVLAGQDRRLPGANATDAQLLAWLHETLGRPQSNTAKNLDWLSPRGDSSRNASRTGGPPHLSARWQARVANDPRLEAFLSSRQQQFQQRNIVALPAARPIAVGDVVLMRTPQNVVAVDWRTGKRIWETREEDFGPRGQSLAELLTDGDREDWPTMSHPVEQRVWDDVLTMSLSSDGQYVFALGGVSMLSDRDDNAGWGVGPMFGGSVDAGAAPTNRLSAYELATEGKLAWEIDGATAADELAGAFFLGSPLAVDGSLYVLAEIRSAIYLLALEPQSGQLQWRQQLAGLEQNIMLDPQRRLSGAVVSHAAGKLICPTTAGMVVAVDMIRREFVWNYRYPRQAESFVTVRQGWRVRSEGRLVRNNGKWLDGSIMIADGRVFLAPPESAELYCLELNTGAELWKRPREDELLIACVEQGKVLLVGSESVSAIRAADGTPAWPDEQLALPEATQPAGLGYLSEGRYYLPLTTGQVVAIDLSAGSVGDPINSLSEVSLGNLICHRGAIISQSALYLDKFEQMEVLRQKAEAALARDPNDATAIRDLAEMRHLDGDLAEAIRMLKRAYETNSEDPMTRDMLADCLLEGLSTNYATYQHDVSLLRSLIDRPQQRFELLRAEALGLHAAGQRLEAFAAYLQLFDAASREPVALTISSAQTARSDRWISARLELLWSECNDKERSEIQRQLKARTASLELPESAVAWRSYLAHFGGLPGMDDARLRYARELVERREMLPAEIELLKLGRSSKQMTQAAAAVLMTQLLIDADRLDDAQRLAATIADRWLDLTLWDDRPPQEWIDRWKLAFESGERPVTVKWPRGMVRAEVGPASTRSRSNGTRRARAEYYQGIRELRPEQISSPRLGIDQWLISPDGLRVIGRDHTGRDQFRLRMDRDRNARQFAGNVDMVQAAQLGDLLYITLGGRILAFDASRDSSQRDDDALWESYPSGAFQSVPRRRRRQPNVYHPWSGRRRLSGRARSMGELGPVNAEGVVIKEHQQVRCVEPLSGETLWSRTDLPGDCEIFGDEDVVVAASLEESKMFVIRMADGELLDRRSLPETPWLFTSGRNICQLDDVQTSDGPRKMIRIVDAVSNDELFYTEYDPLTRMATIEPNEVIVVEPPNRTHIAQFSAAAIMHVPLTLDMPQGRFQLIDVRTGQVEIDHSLPLISGPRSIHSLQSGNQLFLLVNGEARHQPSNPIQSRDYPLIDGQVYAFDRRSGEALWPGPANIGRRGIMLTQPSDIPVLVFVDRETKRDPGGAGSKLRMLCLDKQTGATVYRNDDLPDTTGGYFRARIPRRSPPSIALEMSTRTVTLNFDVRPRPPAPPANDLVEAPRESRGDGLWGIGRRVFQEVIQDPPRADPDAD